eukprot:TRINITY_DN32594_c0_g1_i1.p1 TRINITY_DN32594_c0_g1~~TRINITY_DN32594_c0_g1_i1.p1  ORF type:complete len:173 (-),score=42.80 TRINITY_DN32594_c0_g1_i1:244-762(-)
MGEEKLPDSDEDWKKRRESSMEEKAGAKIPRTPDTEAKAAAEDELLRRDAERRELEKMNEALKERLAKAEEKIEQNRKDAQRGIDLVNEDVHLLRHTAVQTYIKWVSKGRELAARRAVIKGWWRFQFDSRRAVYTMTSHREGICQWILQDTGQDIVDDVLEISSMEGTSLHS